MKKIISILLMTFAFTLYAEKKEIIVSAAASLSGAFTEIGQAFEKKHGIKVSFNFGPTNSLLQQIEKGAPADVFASADQEWMETGIKKGLILDGSKKDFVRNTLVIIAPASSTLNIKSLKDLNNQGIRKICAVQQNSPAGKYAREVLTKVGMLDVFNKKNIPADNVKQAVDYVSREEVDIAFVYKTDASAAKSKVKVIFTASGHKPILYPVAVVKDSKKVNDSKLFIDFIISKDGRSILSKHGFDKP